MQDRKECLYVKKNRQTHCTDRHIMFFCSYVKRHQARANYALCIELVLMSKILRGGYACLSVCLKKQTDTHCADRQNMFFCSYV